MQRDYKNGEKYNMISCTASVCNTFYIDGFQIK